MASLDTFPTNVDVEMVAREKGCLSIHQVPPIYMGNPCSNNFLIEFRALMSVNPPFRQRGNLLFFEAGGLRELGVMFIEFKLIDGGRMMVESMDSTPPFPLLIVDAMFLFDGQ